MRARHVTDPTALSPKTVLADVPTDLSQLVVANYRVTFETDVRYPYSSMPMYR